MIRKVLLYIKYFFKSIYLDFQEYSLGRSGNDIPLEELLEKFRGKRIWNRENKRDWLIWSNNLYAPNLIIIGGFQGKSTSYFLERISSVKRIHVYEPVPTFYTQIKEIFQNQKKVTPFREAIFNGEKLTLELSGDATLNKASGRLVPDHLHSEGSVDVQSISIEKAISRILEDAENPEYSLYMNCEGSEYLILDNMLNHGKLAKSIVVQTHTTDLKSLEKLYDLRAALSRKYVPVLTADWAWDIWVRNDLVNRSVASFEQDSL
jgi:FkbM family methyltransferase